MRLEKHDIVLKFRKKISDQDLKQGNNDEGKESGR